MIFKYIKQEANDDSIVIYSFNQILSLYAVTAQNSRAFHWNVKWKHFIEFHELFEEIYSHLSDSMDDLAERIKAVNWDPICKYSEYISTVEQIRWELNLKNSVEKVDSEDMIASIQEDLEVISYELWRAIENVSGDNVSQDMLIGERQIIDKFLWKLNAINA